MFDRSADRFLAFADIALPVMSAVIQLCAGAVLAGCLLSVWG